MINRDIKSFSVSGNATLRDTIRVMDAGHMGIALVVGEENLLLDVITDGDIRRSLLSGTNLDGPVIDLQKRRYNSRYPKPVAAPVDTDGASLLRLMQQNMVRHVPIVDDKYRVVKLVILSDLLTEQALPLQAVVMAGGYGNRMRPLTDKTPKPMLPVGDKPLLELTLERLRAAGITQVNLSTHYKGEQISHHFGDGKTIGLNINYIHEQLPLGTAGALNLLGDSAETILIMNGDILTQVDFRAMLDFHRDNLSDMTVAVRAYEYAVPFGVVEMNDVRITKMTEKPVMKHFVNGGIYMLNPKVCSLIPKDQPFDMPDFINLLMAEGRRVIGFPVHEYWLDIGTCADYEKAQKAYGEYFEKK